MAYFLKRQTARGKRPVFLKRSNGNKGAIVGTATSSADNSSHGVLLLPIQITQSNYPVPTTPTSVIDSGAPSVTQNIIGSGGTGTAYITGTPAMPQLTAKINGLDSSGMTVDWRLTVTSEIAARGAQDNFSIPAGGGATNVINVPINQAWNMNTYFVAPADFFGGNVTVYFTIKKTDGTALAPEQSIGFKIRGMNPVSNVCKAQIVANEGAVWYAWAVAKNESGDSSGHLYNQFANGLASGGSGAHGAPGDPFNAPSEGNGYGIFQLDTSSGLSVTTEDVWNWNANMIGFLNGEYSYDLQAANTYVNGIKNNPAYQSTFEEPQFTILGVSISGRDVLALTIYNGRQGRSNQTLLHFDPSQPSGSRWSLGLPNAPNKKDPYVNETLKAYNGG
ncbi:MAG: hypothetical protein LV480_12530 [Methylacidiphilales bacterium]|nr:hypothetical protein [Candidatus Methylacidiphilales bacterium]